MERWRDSALLTQRKESTIQLNKVNFQITL